MPEKSKRDVPVSFRLPKESVKRLKELAESHNISRADIIVHLINEAFEGYEKSKKKK
ncbi:CopG family transcriptional regulator [Bdellovibrionota bacterium FG-2]